MAFDGRSFGPRQIPARTLPGNQLIEVIAEGAEGLESLLVEQALDATTEANLVGLALNAYGPAHPTMPAAAESDHGNACNAGCDQA